MVVVVVVFALVREAIGLKVLAFGRGSRRREARTFVFWIWSRTASLGRGLATSTRSVSRHSICEFRFMPIIIGESICFLLICMITWC